MATNDVRIEPGARNSETGVDFIGDVHGYAGALRNLLGSLGYREIGDAGAYVHPSRKAVFVGDLIDRGPEIAETLEIVSRMTAVGSATCVLGNHEWNALGWSVLDPGTGRHLRRHWDSHLRQHRETLEQLSPGELERALDWFRTLPFAADLNGARVVHACWDARALAEIERAKARHCGITDSFLIEAYTPGTPLHHAVEVTLKGPELDLPKGTTFRDKEGTERKKVRTRWFDAPEGRNLRSWSMPPGETLPELALPEGAGARIASYPENAPPVFFGHYWLDGGMPLPLRANVACLDWSVAGGGPLVAYRWQGEQVLDAENFRAVVEDNGRYRELERLAS